uniref:Uncharacterized protein n=2 Tax=Oryza TaxID=4527 RepID=A0A0E0RAT4_ORYRU
MPSPVWAIDSSDGEPGFTIPTRPFLPCPPSRHYGTTGKPYAIDVWGDGGSLGASWAPVGGWWWGARTVVACSEVLRMVAADGNNEDATI